MNLPLDKSDFCPSLLSLLLEFRGMIEGGCHRINIGMGERNLSWRLGET